MAAPRAEPSQVDAHTTLRNAVKLGGSLLVTYVIGFGLQMLVPRMLGVESFGKYNWASNTSTAFFILSALGLDVYIRKEVAVRREHASEFFAGTLLLQVVLALVLLGAMFVVMRLDGQPSEVLSLVLLLGVYQFLYRLNAILAAVLHAHEKVDGLSVAHILMKCIWGFGLGLALWLKVSLPWLAAPFILAELVKAGLLFHLTRKHAGLRMNLDVRATGTALLAALPFFINDAVIATNGRVDSMVLGFIGNTTETGYYGAVWGIAGLTMLLSPILSWVLLPMMSRAASSPEESTRILRRGLEGIFSLSVPVTLALALGAETWVHLLIGPAYLPAAPVLRLLAPVFVLTYVATVCASWLMADNRTWTVTRTSILSAVLNLSLNLVLIRAFLAWKGPTGGASATATSLTICETVVTLILVYAIGSRAWDARSLAVLGKTLGTCAAVTAVHLLLGRFGLDARDLTRGLTRLVVDGVVYLSLILLTGAVRTDEVLGLVRQVRNRRKPQASSSEPPPSSEARAA